MARRLGYVSLAGLAIAGLVWIASAYLQPGLRKAIVFSGFGLC
jgi:hypothetical protein